MMPNTGPTHGCSQLKLRISCVIVQTASVGDAKAIPSHTRMRTAMVTRNICVGRFTSNQ